MIGLLLSSISSYASPCKESNDAVVTKFTATLMGSNAPKITVGILLTNIEGSGKNKNLIYEVVEQDINSVEKFALEVFKTAYDNKKIITVKLISPSCSILKDYADRQSPRIKDELYAVSPKVVY